MAQTCWARVGEGVAASVAEVRRGSVTRLATRAWRARKRVTTSTLQRRASTALCMWVLTRVLAHQTRRHTRAFCMPATPAARAFAIVPGDDRVGCAAVEGPVCSRGRASVCGRGGRGHTAERDVPCGACWRGGDASTRATARHQVRSRLWGRAVADSACTETLRVVHGSAKQYTTE